MARRASIERKTRETSVQMELNVDGRGRTSIATGIRFLDHMLESLARHALFDLKVKASGDVDVDEHHLVEDVGICLGKCLAKALGEKEGIRRFGDAIVPMDEAVATVGLDASGRGYLVLDFGPRWPGPPWGGLQKARWRGMKVGDIAIENIEHFVDSLARNAGLNINAKVEGKNAHHMVEALFKALALALREAVRVEGKGIPSTKGKLE
ncbi:MAG: imidazoleglycerol-phosphate dehydratase HisB [Candidatus Micrarchaeia archaeon]